MTRKCYVFSMRDNTVFGARSGCPKNVVLFRLPVSSTVFKLERRLTSSVALIQSFAALYTIKSKFFKSFPLNVLRGYPRFEGVCTYVKHSEQNQCAPVATRPDKICIITHFFRWYPTVGRPLLEVASEKTRRLIE